MFFQTYDFLWVPQRPARPFDEVMRSLNGLTAQDVGTHFTFEDRVAVRSLMYCVIDNVNLRSMLDGIMLPPPYALLDITDRWWTVHNIAAIVSVLDPKLDALIVRLPFNLAMRLGAYDARLRAASRRLCWVLNVPFEVVEAQEETIANLRAHLQANGHSDGGTALAQQEEITESRDSRKYGLKRAATIGRFAILGGVALVLTGGLAAPLVVPAFVAFATATSVTLGAIGALGTAVLGGTALAGAFAAVVGVGTHVAALASVITPVLSAANVTALFGVGGATLAGLKAARRTGESDTFIIRSVEEVETFTGPATTEVSAAGDLTVSTLAGTNQTVDPDQPGLLGTSWDLTKVFEDGSRPGLVVPAHTRTVAMANVACMQMIKKRNRHIVFSVESQLTGYELRLKAIKLVSGVWGMAPPSTIPHGCCAVFACMNRYMHPTGTGFVLCYVAQPVSTRGGSQAVRLWIRASYDFLGAWELSSFCEGIDRALDPFKAEMRLETNAREGDHAKTHAGLTMEMHLRPLCYLKVYAAAAAKEHVRKGTFPVEELPQRQLEYSHDVKQRRKIGVALVNLSRHGAGVVGFAMVNGTQWPGTPNPMTVEPRTASLTFFTNVSWSLEGAEGYYILEIANRNETPVVPNVFVRVQFEVSSMNNLNVAVATAATLRELHAMELTPEVPESSIIAVPVKEGLFVNLSVRVNAADSVVHLRISNAVERDTSVAIAERAIISIGVCGYSGVFDPRRPMQDQQVGLWQPALRSCALIGPSEAYALQWEDDYLVTFGESIKVDLQLADAVGKKVISKVKSAAKEQLLRGAIFSGFRAFGAFLGAFQLPMYAVWASEVIDNNFATLSNRAVYTGQDLASALLQPHRGNRPVTLVGFSFGSKVIAECLDELDRVDALGIVENVYLMAATISSDRAAWQRRRRVVAGRLVNVYTRSDWALWLMYKVNEGDLKPMAGIAPISVPGVENVDASAVVHQHAGYALQLAEVLGLVPRCPTVDTWSNKSLRGSPGVIVPGSNVKKIARTMSASLNSILSSTPYCAFAVRNSVVTDLPNLAPTLELVAVSTFNCFFDFLPPSEVDAGCAGVFGAVGEDSAADAVGGIFSFRMRLAPYSPRDLLLLVPFYIENNDQVSLTARPSLVTRQSAPQEAEEDADARFITIAMQAVSCLEDVRSNTLGAAPNPAVLTPKAASAEIGFAVPMDGAFLDGHRDAQVRVTLAKLSGGGVAITVLALLTRGTSQLQQERFTEAAYSERYARAAEAAAAVALGSAAALGDDGGPESASSAPSIATVESINDFQSTLFSVADNLRPALSAATDPATSTESRAQTLACIVLANCGQTPLYFGEKAYTRAGSAAELSRPEEGPVTPGEDSGPADSPSAVRQRRQVQWVRFPPPELPPQTFCVLQATNFGGGAFPHLRYETADAACAFEITSQMPSAGGSGHGGPAAATEDGAVGRVDRAVDCAVVAPATAEDDSESAGSPAGEVSTSLTIIRGARFHMVLMTSKGGDPDRSFAAADANDPEIKTVLKSYGWFTV